MSIPDEEFTEQERRVAELTTKIGELLEGHPMHDGIDAVCMVLANLCAETQTPADHLVDALGFTTDFFRELVGDHHEDDGSEHKPESN